MIEIRHILCPVDRSEVSGEAFDYALMLSRWYGASLTAIEMIWVGVPSLQSSSAAPLVLTPTQLNEFSDDLRHFVTGRAPESVQVSVVVREGPMVAGILDEARKRSADLIVMGTHGRGGFDRFVLGSVTEKVLRKASCPVLTVPPASKSAPATPEPFKTILCAVDFSPASLKALRYALALAEESGKRLILLHVFDSAADRPVPAGFGAETSAIRRRNEEEALRELRAAVPDEARVWCDCLELTATGRPYEEILQTAEASQADLIVLGVHGRSTVELALFGSTTNQIVRRATCPVLTIRP